MPDVIRIEALELSSRIGVPEEERTMPQRLTAHILLEPENSFERLRDNLTNAVDYFAVSQAVQELAGTRPRQLVETLAEEIAQMLLTRFPLAAAEVEVRKYVVTGTAFVAVKLRREKCR